MVGQRAVTPWLRQVGSNPATLTDGIESNSVMEFIMNDTIYQTHSRFDSHADSISIMQDFDGVYVIRLLIVSANSLAF